jgi:hypothetical protein
MKYTPELPGDDNPLLRLARAIQDDTKASRIADTALARLERAYAAEYRNVKRDVVEPIAAVLLAYLPDAGRTHAVEVVTHALLRAATDAARTENR